jgi:hypothetical protein
MSTDPEASPFEEALRADLPSAETQARLRRRLLAAGLAVGNGIATTTTAAAAGTAGTSAASGGLLANVVGMSWGIKLGFAAAVAIPTLGLLIDATEPAPSAARSHGTMTAVAAARPPLEPAPPPRANREEAPAEPQLEAAPRVEPPPAPSLAQRRAVPPGDVEPTLVAAPSEELAPSARAFAATAEPPTVPAPNKTTLAAETRLLDAAFAALAAGNRVRAAQLIAEHASRYPQGLLTKERERAKARLSELSRGN